MSQKQLDSQLINAALEGNSDKVCNLLAAGANPNTSTIKFTAPLFIAADIGDAEMIRVMVKAGAKVNMQINMYRDVHTFQSDNCSVPTRNQTSLHVAICKGRTDAVNALLKLGADVFTTYGISRKKTAFHLAVEAVQRKEKRNTSVTEDTARDIAKIIIKQILSKFYHKTKTTLNNGQVVKFNLQTTPRWITDSKLSEYWGNCRDEIREMQNDEIGNSSVLFYQFLSEADPNKLADYLSNEYTGVQQELERGQYAGKYPLYASMIQSQYDKGMERKELLSRSVGVVKCYLAKEGVKKEDVELERVCPRRLEEMLAETARSILTDADVAKLISSRGQETA